MIESEDRDNASLKEYAKHWLLGPQNALWLFDSHWLGQMVRNGVTTSEALDGINAIPVMHRRGQLDTFGGQLVNFWLNQPDAQAVRNRLRITYKEILQEFCRLWESRQPGQRIRVLSLACGSAQATIEALSIFLAAYSEARGQVELHLVDLSGSSLMRATHLAQIRGVQSCVFIHIKDVKSFVREQPDSAWDIVEMVGFLDYRPWKSAENICREIRRIMLVNGLFISAHIGPSPWSFVVRWVTNWPLLIRRTVKEYRQILFGAGFTDREIEMRDEPHRIHPVGVCRKLVNF
ncbi:MAG: methyltransferase domain-containing protein [Candidatus Magasanikbacteria bacterium]|nr:methyltransferase domain-containing protein [Candidatus Magasanikbacteria bacterium]